MLEFGFRKFGFRSRMVGKWGGASYSPEAQALFARFTTPPTDARKALINNLIVALISAGVWAKLDALYLMAAADGQAARQNWKANAFNLAAANSPTFTADRGYAGNGTTAYLDTTFVSSSAGGQFALNSAHMSLWNRTARAGDGSRQMGSITTGVQQIATRVAGDTSFANINDTASLAPASTDNTGHFLANRAGSSTRQFYRNAVSLGSDAAASSALSTQSIFLLGRQSAGALSLPTTDQFAAASIGAALTAQNVADFYAALNAYLQAVGAA